MGTIELLWRRELPAAPRRGRPPRFTVDAVVAAAIAVADRTGLSFTLRDVAQALAAPVMSVYSYIDGREQLLELMVDQCRADMTHRGLSGDWEARLRSVAADNARLFDEHPWMADIESERTVLGPGTLAKYERELAAVEPLGLSDTDKDAALTLVLDFVRSCARARAHARRERTQESPEQWWQREGAKLATLGVTERYPLASRVGTAAGQAHSAAHDADAHYEFGLRAILHGIDALDRRQR
ncbi:TetR/AcrR family transcriptional regulator C-terminal domain-containing protein [Mycolicibacterium psychrotolerans]|uniref:TetR family transcriptional regulator n=1 Tax=Mycolicibacterium psychrotolerans TaxID=216929 RepID=A0A7I7M743_9MYCO|nr:TetR/AcrR family transcriptional regulator C-terminal domain-containing protein [Mycolicibacterium psychrotolerans]BBX68005.1 TetR family transcriptional regulator [Mycolicibacterium psychrotolerans]